MVIFDIFAYAIVPSPTCCVLVHGMCANKISDVAQNTVKDSAHFALCLGSSLFFVLGFISESKENGRFWPSGHVE